MKKAEDVKVIMCLTYYNSRLFRYRKRPSDVHVKSLCDEAQKYMFEAGATQLRLEGYREGRWIVIDYGDILIHIFHKNEREFYGLERL
jgi:ribosome-associated protein